MLVQRLDVLPTLPVNATAKRIRETLRARQGAGAEIVVNFVILCSRPMLPSDTPRTPHDWQLFRSRLEATLNQSAAPSTVQPNVRFVEAGQMDWCDPAWEKFCANERDYSRTTPIARLLLGNVVREQLVRRHGIDRSELRLAHRDEYARILEQARNFYGTEMPL